MTRLSLAIPASVLILALAVPSSSQTSPDTAETAAFPKPMQTAAQVSTAANPPGPRPLSDEEMAALCMVRKEYYEAAVIYKRLSEQNPRNAVYLNRLGIALHQQTALSQALKYYQKSMKADPKYADAQNNIGTIWYERKRFGKAIRAYQKAIALRADAPSFYMNLGYAYFGEKEYERSIASFREALALDPTAFETAGARGGTLIQDRSVMTDRGQFYFLLAKSFAMSGNAERCALYLRKAKDEGYKYMEAIKGDPSFASVVASPAIQSILEVQPETAQP
jgi:tetratricopeptide (TPR) repeat protein